MEDFPRIISADDHVVEPMELWTSRLPAKFLVRGPRVVREKGVVRLYDGDWRYVTTDDGGWTDVWEYEDLRFPTALQGSAVGFPIEEMELRVITFDDMRKGCYDPVARLADMDQAGIEASLCFPNLFVRFCGQRFQEAQDKELALACVQAYNDFIVDEWTAGSGGRLIPLGIIPLWDAALAKAEVERVAARGMKAFCFSEIPPYLGLPSIHTDYWDPFFAACVEADVAIMMHIGSSSRLPSTSADAPNAVMNSVQAVNSAMSMVDWLYSGVLIRFPTLRLGMAECQIGWIPYFLERADEVWSHNRAWNEAFDKIPNPPSSYFGDHFWCTFFSDRFGLQNVDAIGVDNIMFETDYPHSDSNWPTSLDVAKEQTAHLDAAAVEKIVRGNAKALLKLP
jgi:predicted TIM-barrel fold metal-dependent hydrolase